MSGVDFATCKPGQMLRVTGFSSGISCAYRRLLLAMGIVPHTIIKFLRRSPLGDPIVIAVRGSKLCLRKDEMKLLNLEYISE